MKNLILFSKYHIQMKKEDWDFMCKYRWFSENPPFDEIEAEFEVCGLRDAKDDAEANRIVEKTVEALREIMELHTAGDGNEAVNVGISAVAHMKADGTIYITKACETESSHEDESKASYGKEGQKDTIRIMLRWKEFNENSKISLRDDFQDKPDPNRDKIIRYLDNGKFCVAAFMAGKDVLTGENVCSSYKILTDGEYTWANTLSHYVKKYNLKLPEEFVEKIINS